MLRRLTVLLPLLFVFAAAPAAGSYSDLFAPFTGNPADGLADQPIDAYRYDYAKRCRSRPRSGAVALQRWLEHHAQGMSWGIMRCEMWGKRSASLHAEGRALDWHLDVRDPAQRREGMRLLHLMLATDRSGNAHALARRMGVQEIIWNCRAWWSGASRLVKYKPCYGRGGQRLAHVDPTIGHLDHVHFGLNLAGASERTSFWRSDTDDEGGDVAGAPAGGVPYGG